MRPCREKNRSVPRNNHQVSNSGQYHSSIYNLSCVLYNEIENLATVLEKVPERSDFPYRPLPLPCYFEVPTSFLVFHSNFTLI